jgi:hypothetical protein
MQAFRASFIHPMLEKDRFKGGLSLDFRQVGDIESFFFKSTPLVEVVLESTQVLLEPKLYSLTKKVCSSSGNLMFECLLRL